MAWNPQPIDANLIRDALEMSVSSQLSHWDALIVAAALRSGCTSLVVTAYGSDGSTQHMPDKSLATATIKDAQRRRARCARGSRRHAKRGRRLATMQRRRAHRRRNARRHLAKAIASTRGIRAVAVEDLSLRNMLRSAKGTRQQPGSHVRAKTGLNRSLSRAGLAELHSFIKRACAEAWRSSASPLRAHR